MAYYAAGNNRKHVIYRSSDGHLADLSWVPGTATPTYIDLTAYAVAPLAADKPTAFVDAPNTHYVAYRGTDHQIHEIRWSQPSPQFHVSFPVTDAFEMTAQPTPPSLWHRTVPAGEMTVDRRPPR